MQQKGIFLYSKDFEDFQKWLCLNIEELTWQGRYKTEFEDFWNLFFLDGLSLAQVLDRFSYSLETIKSGPLLSWFNWLRNRFLIYCFIKKEFSVNTLSETFDIPISQVSVILRDYFNQKYPHLFLLFNSKFECANILSPNAKLTYEKLKGNNQWGEGISGPDDSDILSSLEITLYDDWKLLLKNMKRDFIGPQVDLKRLSDEASFSKQQRFIREVFVLFVIGMSLIFGISFANKTYEKYLSGKINIFQPEFLLDNSILSFKEEEKNKDALKEEIKNIESIADKSNVFFRQEERQIIEPESDVVLTSVDDLPKQFESVGFELSDYEEVKKGGFRDARYGFRRVYRVLIKSIDSKNVKRNLNTLLKKNEVSQVDNVKPGKEVPGGLYYNVYVPSKNLKNFLTQVSEVEDAIIYENSSRTNNPPGVNRVFIWIKQI